MLRAVSRASGVLRSSAAVRVSCALRRVAINNYNRCIHTQCFRQSDASHKDFEPITKQSVAASLDDARKIIQDDISNNEVFLYMKGSPSSPRCGFSANVVKILSHYPLSYGSRDVLVDDAVRESIKTFSDWPTLPQLYVKGEFIGGSDIITNLFKTGELDKILGVKRS